MRQSDAKRSDFGSTFAALRKVLARHKAGLAVTVDEPGDYQLSSSTMKDRIGRPLFVAGVQIKKNYVSYHLMPIYMNPALQKKLSPALRKRMQGKSCFNFTDIAPEQIGEISDITRAGFAMFKNLQLPWDRGAGKATKIK